MAYLLSIPSHRQAVLDSISQPDSLSRASAEGPSPSTTHDEWDPVFLVARWNEVRQAREAELEHRRQVLDAERVELDLRLLDLRLSGATEERCAAVLSLSKSSARRRFGSLLEAIVDRLGGPPGGDPPQTSSVSACMRCAAAPRERSSHRRRVPVDGRRTTVTIERQHSLCEGCLEEQRVADLAARAARLAARRRAAGLEQVAAAVQRLMVNGEEQVA